MNKRFTLRLPADLLAQARRKAAAERRTLSSLVEEGLRLVVARKRLPVPVSTASGGLAPGVDITRFSDIQGDDDVEYMNRMKGFE